MTDSLTVRFSRIGRTHNPDPLCIPITEAALPDPDCQHERPGDRINWDVVAERIHDYARPMIRSSDPEVVLTFIETFGGGLIRVDGQIVVGGFRNAGEFTVEPPAPPDGSSVRDVFGNPQWWKAITEGNGAYAVMTEHPETTEEQP